MTTFAVIVGNRGFFPSELCEKGRQTILNLLKEKSIKAIVLQPEDTQYGSVETFQDAKKCAALFKRHADEIDGILVTLPNFGDEKAVADSIRMSNLDVPVLVHAFPDESQKMNISNRRDSFCGKISVCNNLFQYKIPYSLTKLHTVDPASALFHKDLQEFEACCRVVRGLRGARIGAIGARPAAFNTVRYSEKILEKNGISVETIDLFEVIGRIKKLNNNEGKVKVKVDAIKSYINTNGVEEELLIKMAKLGVVLDEWIEEKELCATAVQCWTAIEEYFGVVPCTVMSMLTESLSPSGCEVDIAGAISMLSLQYASGKPSALLDLNNNYDNEENMCVLFHCSNLPKSVFREIRMGYQEIIGGTVGIEKSYGTCIGNIKSGPFTFARVTTDDFNGNIRAYIGQGEIIDSKLSSFGGYGVARIPDLQKLLNYICIKGFEHHIAFNPSRVAKVINEAFSKYLKWEVFCHKLEQS